MTDPRRLAPLARLAGLTLDAELAELRRLKARRDATLAALETLDRPVRDATGDLPPVAAWRAEMQYRKWADARRAEINTRLAAQTAAWMQSRDSAARAFGRKQALETIEERLVRAAHKAKARRA